MNYKIVNIRTSSKVNPQDAILIIYTGGTFGMAMDEDGSLAPFNFGKVIEQIPELKALDLRITVISFPEPRDSSNIDHQDWQNMAFIIFENYAQYDGFVILHGTDTMAYSASALSYMLRGLTKPVIFTGAQIPIGSIRSDARENLITALEIASKKINGVSVVREVCVYFNFYLLRGNRAQKIKSSTFAAFESQNYPILAESGINIEFNYAHLNAGLKKEKFKLLGGFNDNIVILKIFPGINKFTVTSILRNAKLKGIILESYGSGNTMNHSWFLSELKLAVKRDVIIFNVSQCSGGEVVQGRYETSKQLNDIGVVSGGDITTEAATTKLMFLLANENDSKKLKLKLGSSIVGEMDE
ncbi:MAG: asparaginase [Cyclobacteriaceae bacterium]